MNSKNNSIKDGVVAIMKPQLYNDGHQAMSKGI
jgi:hypothetical protein